VPSAFRAVLAHQHFQGIVAYHSFVNDCIEACGMDRIEQLSESIDDLDPFSPERDAFATAILGSCVQLPFDGEGRVMLPPYLLEKVGLSDQLVFVGKGKAMEIWHPDVYASYAEEARKLAMEKRQQLRLKGGQPS